MHRHSIGAQVVISALIQLLPYTSALPLEPLLLRCIGVALLLAAYAQGPRGAPPACGGQEGRRSALGARQGRRSAHDRAMAPSAATQPCSEQGS